LVVGTGQSLPLEIEEEIKEDRGRYCNVRAGAVAINQTVKLRSLEAWEDNKATKFLNQQNRNRDHRMKWALYENRATSASTLRGTGARETRVSKRESKVT
jgi:hypothetical protein